MAQELSLIVDKVRQQIDPLERQTLQALIVIDVHSNYVVDELIEKNVDSVD